MPAVRIEVGAAVSSNLGTVFRPIEEASSRARRKIEADAKAAVRTQEREYAKLVAMRERASRQEQQASLKATQATVRDEQRAAQAISRAKQQQVQADMRAHTAMVRERARTRETENREITRWADKTARAEQRAGVRSQKEERRESRQRWGNIGREAGRLGMSGLRAAGRFAGDVARGMGVRLDVASNVANTVDSEKKAVNIVNQAEMAGQHQAPGAAQGLVKQARQVAYSKRVGSGEALDVLGEFQAFSSDLETGKQSLGDLATLAKVTGSAFGDIGSAAGRVNAMLEEGPDKAERLLSVMRLLSKQTANGSVEMEDFSKYIGRLAANATKFEGTFEENIGGLGALAQMAMKGGASTASEATGSAAAWARDLTKARTIKKWDAAFGEGAVFADKGKTKLKSPEKVIEMYLKKFGADQSKLALFFPNDVSKRGVQNSMKIFEEAGGGEAGLEAVRAEFAKFKETLTPEQISTMDAATAGTTADKAAQFNARLEEITEKMITSLIPAFEQMAPVILQAATMIGFLSTGIAKLLGMLGVDVPTVVPGGGGPAAALGPDGKPLGDKNDAAKIKEALVATGVTTTVEERAAIGGLIGAAIGGATGGKIGMAAGGAIGVGLAYGSESQGKQYANDMQYDSYAGPSEVKAQVAGKGIAARFAGIVAGAPGGDYNAQQIAVVAAAVNESNAALAAIGTRLGGTLTVHVDNPTPAAGGAPPPSGGSGMPVPENRG